MDRSDADVAVIGAGVMGCAIAYELSRLGYDVLVLERNLGAGTGSTGASSAAVRFNYSQRTAVAASWECVHRWQAWSDYLAAPQGEPLAAFVRTGGLDPPGPGPGLRGGAQPLRRHRHPVRPLERRPDQARVSVARPDAALPPEAGRQSGVLGRARRGRCGASGCPTPASSTIPGSPRTTSWGRRPPRGGVPVPTVSRRMSAPLDASQV